MAGRLIGEAWISIVPDTSKFPAELKSLVEKAVKESASSVAIGADTSEAMTRLTAFGKEAQAALDATPLQAPVSLNSGEALTSAAKARESLQAVFAKALRLDVNMDDTGLLARATALRASAMRGLEGLEITPEMSEADVQSVMASARGLERQLDDIFKSQRIPVRLEDEQLGEDLSAEQARLDAITGKVREIRFHAEDGEAEAAIDALLARADALDAKTYKVRVDADLVPLIAEISALGAAAQKAAQKFTLSPDYAASSRDLGEEYSALIQAVDALQDSLGDAGLEGRLTALSTGAYSFGKTLREAFSDDEIAAAATQLTGLKRQLDDIYKAQRIPVQLDDEQLSTALADERARLDAITSKVREIAFHADDAEAEAAIDALLARLHALDAKTYKVRMDTDLVPLIAEISTVGAAAEAASRKFTVSPDYAEAVRYLDGDLATLIQGLDGLPGALPDQALHAKFTALAKDAHDLGQAVREAFSEDELLGAAVQLSTLQARFEALGKAVAASTPSSGAKALSAELAGTGPGPGGLGSAGGSLQDLRNQLQSVWSNPASVAFTGTLRDLQAQLEKLHGDAAGLLTDADAATIAARYGKIEAALTGVEARMQSATQAGAGMRDLLLAAGGAGGAPSPVPALEGRVAGLYGQGAASGSPALLAQAAGMQKQMAALRAAMGAAFSDADWAGAVQQFGTLTAAADDFEKKVAAIPADVAASLQETGQKARDLQVVLNDLKPDISPDSAAHAELLRLQAQAARLRDALATMRTGIEADQARATLIDLTVKAAGLRASLADPAALKIDVITALAGIDKAIADIGNLQARLGTVSRASLVNSDSSQAPEIAMMTQALDEYLKKAQAVKAAGISSASDIASVTTLTTSVKSLSGAMDTLDGGVSDGTKRWGGLINAMLSITRLHIPLFNGALSDIHLPNFIASASGLHLLIEGAVELGYLAPAIIGAGAFALASAADFKAVYTQFTAVKTAYQATGQAVGNLSAQQARAAGLKGPVGPQSLMSGSVSQAVQPQVWTLYGELITGASKSTGEFGAGMTRIGQTFDQLGQKIVDTLGNSHGAFTSANRDIQGLATSFEDIGKIVDVFLKSVPGYAEKLLDLGNMVLGFAASLAQAIQPEIRVFLALHGGILYIGMAATAIGALGKAIIGGFIPAFQKAGGPALAFINANKAATASVKDLNAAVAAAGATSWDQGAARQATRAGVLPAPAALQVQPLQPGDLSTVLKDVEAGGAQAPGVATALAAIATSAEEDIKAIDALGTSAAATMATMRAELAEVQAQALETASSLGVLGSMTGRQAAALSPEAKMDALMRAANTEATAAMGLTMAGPATKVEALSQAVQDAGKEALTLKAAGTGAAVGIGDAMAGTTGRVSKLGAALGAVSGSAVSMGAGMKSASSGVMADIKGILTGTSGALSSLGTKAASAGKGVLGWVGSLVGFTGEAAPIAGGILLVGGAIGFVADKALTAQTAAQKFTGSLEATLKSASVAQFSQVLSSNFTQVQSNLAGTGTQVQQWARQWEAATGGSVEGTVGLTHALALMNQAARSTGGVSGSAKGGGPTAQQRQLALLGSQAQTLASDYGVYQKALDQGKADQASFTTNLGKLTPVAGSASAAIGALTTAGITNAQMLDTSAKNQQFLIGIVASVTAGYAAMTYGVGGANTALETMNVTTSSAYTSVQNLTGAWSTFLGIVTGSANAFSTFENQFLTVAEATGKAIPGASTATAALLKAATTATASTTSSTSDTSSSSAGTSASRSKGTSASATSGTSTTSTSGSSSVKSAASDLTTAVKDLSRAVSNSTAAGTHSSNTDTTTRSRTSTSSSGTSSSLTIPGNKDKTLSINSKGKLTGGGSNAISPSDVLNGLSPSSLGALQAYIQQLSSGQQLFAALQTQATVSGNSKLAQYSLGRAGKDITAQLSAIPGVGQSTEATSMLGTLATQMGYTGPVTSFKDITKWAGSATGAEADLNKQQQVLTITSANLSADAGALAKTMSTQLSGAMSSAIFGAEGGQKAMNSFATAVKNFKSSQSAANFAAMRTSGLKVAQMLFTMTGSTSAAKQQFETFMVMMGSTQKEADKLWATYNIGSKATKSLASQFTGTFQQAFSQATTTMGLSRLQANKLWEELRQNHLVDVDGNVAVSKGNFDKLTTSMHLSQGQAQTLWRMLQTFDGANIKTTVTVDVGGAGTIKVSETGIPVPYASAGAAAKVKGLSSLFSLSSGMAEGGLAKVGGGWGGGDRIPALLEPGELVVPKRAVPAFAHLAKRMGVPGFDAGGLVGDTSVGKEVASVIAGVKGNASAYVSAAGQSFVRSTLQQFQQLASQAAPSTAGITSASASMNLLTIAKYLVSAGYSPAAAAGIAGDIYGESGANPEAVGPGNSLGLIQWTGTWGGPGYPGGSPVTGDASADLATQLQGVIAYNDQNATRGLGVLKSMTDPIQAADYYSRYFERPLVALSDVRAGVTDQVYAELLSYLQGQGASGHMAMGGIAGMTPGRSARLVPAPPHAPAHKAPAHKAPAPPPHKAPAHETAIEKARAAAGKQARAVLSHRDAMNKAVHLIGNDLALASPKKLKGIGPHRTAAGMITQEASAALPAISEYDKAYSRWGALRDAYDRILHQMHPKTAKKPAPAGGAITAHAGKPTGDLRAAFDARDLTAVQKHAWHLLHESHVKRHATGGIINGSAIGRGLRSGMPYSFAESRPEKVTPLGPASQGFGNNTAQVAMLLAKQNQLLAQQNQLLAQQPAMLSKALSTSIGRGVIRS